MAKSDPPEVVRLSSTIAGASMYFASGWRNKTEDFRIRRDLEAAHRELSLIGAGLKPINAQRRGEAPSAEAPPLSGSYASQESVEQRFGKERVTKWATRPPGYNREISHLEEQTITGPIKRRAKACRIELDRIRQQFDPDHKSFDYHDGSPPYIAAVDACLAKHFPSILSVDYLRKELDYAGDWLEWDTRDGGRTDAQKLTDVAHYFADAAVYLRIEGRPARLNSGEVNPASLQQFLSSLRTAIPPTQ